MKKYTSKNFAHITFMFLFFIASTAAIAQQDRGINSSKNFELNFNQKVSYESNFLYNDNASRSLWLANPGEFYDAPQDINDTEFEIAYNFLQQKVFNLMNSEKISPAYELCKSKANTLFMEIPAKIRTDAAASNLAEIRDEKLNHANTLSKFVAFGPHAMCAFRVIRRGLIELGVPNYYPQQNRSVGVTISYENLYIGQIYRFVHAVTNERFTDRFYDRINIELALDYSDWLKREFSDGWYDYRGRKAQMDDATVNIIKRNYFRYYLNLAEVISKKKISP